MRFLTYRHIFIFVLLVVIIGCGDGNGPNPQDPWTGTAGNLLVSEIPFQDKNSETETFWVGFNSSTEWTSALQRMRNDPSLLMVRGKIVPTQNNSAGFYFAPDTTDTSGTGIPEWVIPVDFIKANPQQYATTSPEPIIPIGVWYVMLKVERIVPR